MKAIQYFTDEYIEYCKKLTIDQRLRFLEDFRKLHGKKTKPKSRLISIRISEDLLELFKKKSEAEGKKYQVKMKELMSQWCGLDPIN